MSSRNEKRLKLGDKREADALSERSSDADVIETSREAWATSAPAKNNYTGASRRPISPPRPRKKNAIIKIKTESSDLVLDATQLNVLETDHATSSTDLNVPQQFLDQNVVSSPIKLSTVNGVSASDNIDTLSLRDILGDPLIKECWLFNYLFDVDFIMSQPQPPIWK